MPPGSPSLDDFILMKARHLRCLSSPVAFRFCCWVLLLWLPKGDRQRLLRQGHTGEQLQLLLTSQNSWCQVMLVRHKAEGEDHVYAMKMLRKVPPVICFAAYNWLIPAAVAARIAALGAGECDKAEPSRAHQDRAKRSGGRIVRVIAEKMPRISKVLRNRCSEFGNHALCRRPCPIRSL